MARQPFALARSNPRIPKHRTKTHKERTVHLNHLACMVLDTIKRDRLSVFLPILPRGKHRWPFYVHVERLEDMTFECLIFATLAHRG